MMLVNTNVGSDGIARGSSKLTFPQSAALTGLLLSTLISSVDASIASAGLPIFEKEFAASFHEIQWIILSYLVVIAASIGGIPWLAEVIGRRRLLLSGIVVFVTGSFIAGEAPALWLLIFGRALQGLGASAMMALTSSFVDKTIPQRKARQAMGWLAATSALGATMGPFVGGVLIAQFGWASVFLINVPLGLFNLALALRYLPPDPPKNAREYSCFDKPGTLVLAVVLVFYALAPTVGCGQSAVVNLALMLIVVLAVCLFIQIDAKAVLPVLQLEVLRHPVLSKGLAINTLVSTVMMASLVVGPFYLARVLSLDVIVTGLALSAGPTCAALFGIPVMKLVRRYGPLRMTVVGLAGMGAGCLFMMCITQGLGVVGYLVGSILVACSHTLIQMANNTLIWEHTHPKQLGKLPALFSLSRNLGLISGASVLGAIFSLSALGAPASAAQANATISGAHATFDVAIILVLMAILLSRRSRIAAYRPQ